MKEAGMAKLVDARDLKSLGEIRTGSSPVPGILEEIEKHKSMIEKLKSVRLESTNQLNEYYHAGMIAGLQFALAQYERKENIHSNG